MLKRRSTPLGETDILAAIEFLIAEARRGVTVPHQGHKYLMRVASNFHSIGRDAGSSEVKKRSKLRSVEAHKLWEALGFSKAWYAGTINEHQDPLDQVWRHITETRDTITAREVGERFKKYPMVVVTKDEDRALNGYDLESPEARYRLAKIDIVRLRETGEWN